MKISFKQNVGMEGQDVPDLLWDYSDSAGSLLRSEAFHFSFPGSPGFVPVTLFWESPRSEKAVAAEVSGKFTKQDNAREK